MIETLKLLASGQALLGTIIKHWLWVNEGKFYRCITIPGYNIPHNKFREFVNKIGGVHYVFKPGINPYIPKGPGMVQFGFYKLFKRRSHLEGRFGRF